MHSDEQGPQIERPFGVSNVSPAASSERTRRPKIGLFDSSAHVSGISRYVRTVITGVDRNEFDVVVFAERPELYADIVETVDIRSPRVESAVTVARQRRSVRTALRAFAPDWIKLTLGYFRDSRRLARVLSDCPVDLLHIQLVGADSAASAARRAHVGAILGTLHIDSSRSTYRRWLVELVTNHSLHHAIAVSRATAVDWHSRTRLSLDRITTIPNAVDTHFYQRRRSNTAAKQALGLPEGDYPLIVAVGRLSEQKGFADLIDAVAGLSDRIPNVAVAIAGEGPLRESLLARGQTLGTAKLYLLGMQNDVRPVLEAADLFVLPSLWEAMPYALLEAMAMGLAVVGTTVAGVPDVIEGGRSGLLVPPRDVSSLRDAILALLTDPALRQEMGRQARLRIENSFSERQMLSSTLQVYRQMLRQ